MTKQQKQAYDQQALDLYCKMPNRAMFKEALKGFTRTEGTQFVELWTRGQFLNLLIDHKEGN